MPVSSRSPKKRPKRLPLIIASILCSLTFSDAAYSTPQKKKPVNSRKLGLVIKVEGGGWGNVSRETIETVLYSVADELLARLPKKLSTTRKQPQAGSRHQGGRRWLG